MVSPQKQSGEVHPCAWDPQVIAQAAIDWVCRQIVLLYWQTSCVTSSLERKDDGGRTMVPDEKTNAIHQWWRFFGNLRFSQLGFYGVIAGLLLNAMRGDTSVLMTNRIAVAGVLVTAVVWLMEISSTLHGIAWKKRADVDPPAGLFPPFNASNAVLGFYIFAYTFWWRIATEHLRSICFTFWVLVTWSAIAYLPLWVHSIRTFKEVSAAYKDSFRKSSHQR